MSKDQAGEVIVPSGVVTTVVLIIGHNVTFHLAFSVITYMSTD